MVEELEGIFAKYAPQNKMVISDDISLLKGMDVLTTEEWEYTNSSTGDDHGYDAWMSYAEALIPYRLTSELMEVVDNPDCVVLHMLPSLHNADHSLGQQLIEEAPDQATKDLIASGLEISDVLILLTAVDHVAINFGKPDQVDLEDISVDEAERYVEEGQFGKGSMEPKVRAGIRFVRSRPGRTCIIGSLEKAAEAITGSSGTRIHE